MLLRLCLFAAHPCELCADLSAAPMHADDALESPSTYLWTLYFLASHHSQLGDHSAALSTLSLALSHTPSLPELHTLRARILKRAGDAQGAAQAMEDARLLDGQDRFLNSKAAKYAVRNGEFERAEKTIGLFTRVRALELELRPLHLARGACADVQGLVLAEGRAVAARGHGRDAVPVVPAGGGRLVRCAARLGPGPSSLPPDPRCASPVLSPRFSCVTSKRSDPGNAVLARRSSRTSRRTSTTSTRTACASTRSRPTSSASRPLSLPPRARRRADLSPLARAGSSASRTGFATTLASSPQPRAPSLRVLSLLSSARSTPSHL